VRSPAIEAFWRDFRAAGGPDHDAYEVVSFGDSPALADELAELVLAGRKRATAFLARDMAAGAETPTLGGHVVVVDGAGRPRLIWRTTELRIGPLISVDDAFAWDEGEGDRSRAHWLAEHRRYFARQAARDGFAMHDGIEVVFERFTVVWPPEAADR
jgi:uncharacterized protein YhfF